MTTSGSLTGCSGRVAWGAATERHGLLNVFGRAPGTWSLSGVVGTLQILLATRRAARTAAYAHRPSLAREA
jgi:hypothetical protein